MQKRRIYIVDDETPIASTLAAIFKDSGYETECFTRPRTLLEVAAIQRPDALVSDYTMPELSSIELARCVFAMFPACRIFVISGTELSLIKSAVSEAPTPHLTLFSKPVQIGRLLDAVAHACRIV